MQMPSHPAPYRPRNGHRSFRDAGKLDQGDYHVGADQHSGVMKRGRCWAGKGGGRGKEERDEREEEKGEGDGRKEGFFPDCYGEEIRSIRSVR